MLLIFGGRRRGALSRRCRFRRRRRWWRLLGARDKRNQRNKRDGGESRDRENAKMAPRKRHDLHWALDVRARSRDACRPRRTGLLVLFVIVVIIIFVVLVIILVVEEVAIFPGSTLCHFFLFFLIVVGDTVQVHGMSLRYFELGLALGTSQDFPFFDFVFIDVDFGGTFRAADHGSILRWNLRMTGRYFAPARCSVLYTALREVKACHKKGRRDCNGKPAKVKKVRG